MIYPKVVFGQPVGRSGVSLNCYFGTFLNIRSYPGEVGLIARQNMYIGKARNEITREFLRNPANEYLFFLDSDIGIPLDCLKTLVEDKKDIISALAFRRVEPFNPVMYRKIPNGYEPIMNYKKGVIRVDATGADCLLINRKVFESIEYPWFAEPDKMGEDFFFHQKREKAGFPLFVDTRLVCNHETQLYVDEQTLKGGKLHEKFYDNVV